MRKLERPVLKEGDKVYWRSTSGGKNLLKSGRVVAIVPAHIKSWDIVLKHKLNETYSCWKLEQKRFNPARDHESYLIVVSKIESGKSYKKQPLYWPVVYKLRKDTRQPIPAMFLPEDE